MSAFLGRRRRSEGGGARRIMIVFTHHTGLRWVTLRTDNAWGAYAIEAFRGRGRMSESGTYHGMCIAHVV